MPSGTQKRTLQLPDVLLEYTWRRSRQSKRIRLSVRADASVLVTSPPSCPLWRVEKLLAEQRNWILHHQQMVREEASSGADDPERYRVHKEAARRLVTERLAYFNRFYGFTYGRISIRDQKTRWGSCSGKGNLNFNYRLVFLTAAQADYIVVHELCHLKEMNHSPRFWRLVELTVPNYKELRAQLRQQGIRVT